MLISRLTDEKMGKLVRQNKGATFQLSAAGHEMAGVVAAQNLIPGKDWGLPYYRDQPFVVGLGGDLVEIFGAFLARKTQHHSAGRMMPGHFSCKPLRIPCQSSVVGAQYLQAVGLALSRKLVGATDIVYVSGGEGSTSQGDFHEALNFAALHQLSVIFSIHDNGLAISVPVHEQTAGGSIISVAKGHVGIAVFEADSTDFISLNKAFSEAAERGRSGKGPSVVVTKMPRLAAHSSSDDPLKYRKKEELEEDKAKDPLVAMRAFVLKSELLDPEEIIQLEKQCFQEVEEAAAKADLLPYPDSESALDNIYAPFSRKETVLTPLSQEKIVMMDAINHALDEEMATDPGMIVFGEDVARGKGGVFGITKNLTDKYGEWRCFNTPLAESTIIGVSIGMAIDGSHRPVAEIQFADYIWTGINQLFNQLSSYYYRSNGEWNCPVVIRMPTGGYIQGGPYHSQNIEGFLSHCPGLMIAYPSNAADAKGLLKWAIRSPNPVIFLEHKALYRQQRFSARPEPDADYILPFGKAAIVRPGTDITLVTWGMMVLYAVDAAEKLAAENISIEVLDLRTISPLDKEAILISVQKTGKVLILHEAAKTAGFGAEIAALIAEKAFEYLDAPLVRMGAEDTPVPYSKILENRVLPQPSRIEAELKKLAQY
ncbi:MAG: thiamine pyrophosphate-dependent enzyme [Chlamydiae bacterium]|nr:thiamine pyrophosphate-dependent enzyme [Chlamydiota bacterium]